MAHATFTFFVPTQSKDKGMGGWSTPHILLPEDPTLWIKELRGSIEGTDGVWQGIKIFIDVVGDGAGASMITICPEGRNTDEDSKVERDLTLIISNEMMEEMGHAFLAAARVNRP